MLKTKNFYTVLFIFFFIQLQGQNNEDWTWYDSPFFSQLVTGLEQDNNGDIWMISGSRIIKFDGVDWFSIDLLDLGLSPADAYPRSIDSSLGDILWIVTDSRVVAYNLNTNQWVIHNPDNLINGRTIKVESADRIWVTASYRLWEYNGTEWIAHFIYDTDVVMNESTTREIAIDNNNQKWMTTPSSFCIDVACFTPAGVIRLSDTDTTLFDAASLGLPDAQTIYLELDSNGNPVLAINGYQTNDNYYMSYIDGQWTIPVEIPYSGSMLGMELGNEDQIYAVFNDFIAIGKYGVWDVIPLDPNNIQSVWSFLVDSDNDVYVAGRTGNNNTNYEPSFGYLPDLNYRIRGLLYSDRNYNGVFDETDQTIPYRFVQTVNQDRISFSNNAGAYSLLFSEPGTYEIEGVLPEYHSYGIPLEGIHTILLSQMDDTSNNNNIGYEPDTTAIDLSLSLTALNIANPGFQTCYLMSAKNNAPRLTEGELILNFDDILSFESSDEIPVAINGNQLTFDLPTMEWLEIKNIEVCFLLPPDPSLVGDTLKHDGIITAMGGIDLVLENNTDSLCHHILGPYDPNFIDVNPKGNGITGEIPFATNSLEYTIHFQNIGTDTARNVVINNPIDENLDILSLNVIGYSDEYDVTFKEEGRVLEWSFPGINLPDSMSNAVTSNGFIKYTIDLASNEIGTVLLNQADIFFDFNLPISTNTTMNTLVEESVSTIEVSPIEKCDYKIKVLGNDLIVDFTALGVFKVGVYDLSGKRLYASFVHQKYTTINLMNLPKGIYTVVVESENCAGRGELFVW